jgi:hypothetical protein
MGGGGGTGVYGFGNPIVGTSITRLSAVQRMNILASDCIRTGKQIPRAPFLTLFEIGRVEVRLPAPLTRQHKLPRAGHMLPNESGRDVILLPVVACRLLPPLLRGRFLGRFNGLHRHAFSFLPLLSTFSLYIAKKFEKKSLYFFVRLPATVTCEHCCGHEWNVNRTPAEIA